MRAFLRTAPLVLLLLASCGLTKEYAVRRYHGVETDRAASGAPPARPTAAGTVLEVQRLEVAESFEGVEIVRRTGEHTWEPDFYDVFFVPPGAMLTGETRRWIAESGLFGNVVDVSSLAEATHVLEGNVTALYGDLRDGESKAVLEIQFVLLDQRVEPPGIAWSGTFAESIVVANDSAAALVAGWSEGLAKILGRLEEDLSRVKLAAGS